eukprot:scaffold5262_cov51-Phaeocystis_antarctica.AAC.2
MPARRPHLRPRTEPAVCSSMRVRKRDRRGMGHHYTNTSFLATRTCGWLLVIACMIASIVTCEDSK